MFDQAVDEPSFCDSKGKHGEFVNYIKADDDKSIFSYALVKNCQMEIECIFDGSDVDERQVEIDNTSDKQL